MSKNKGKRVTQRRSPYYENFYSPRTVMTILFVFFFVRHTVLLLTYLFTYLQKFFFYKFSTILTCLK